MKSAFDKTLIADNGSPFGGPGRNHFDYDLMKGFIALYDSTQNITDENGQPNRNYWFINNAGKHYPPDAETAEMPQE